MAYSTKRRFMAGAVCPRCSEMDKLVVYHLDGKDYPVNNQEEIFSSIVCKKKVLEDQNWNILDRMALVLSASLVHKIFEQYRNYYITRAHIVYEYDIGDGNFGVYGIVGVYKINKGPA